MNQLSEKENKMGTMPVNKLLISMAVPMMISMLVQALYNIIDSMFVAKVSEEALAAVSLAFPMQNLMIAVGTGTGVGINALLSKSLGEKNKERANETARQGIFIVLIWTLVFIMIGLFLIPTFMSAQIKDLTKEEADMILPLGIAYLKICTIGSLGFFMQVTFERLLQSTGRTVLSMITQGLGAIINIILDPILIFGLLGAPKMGVKGAALATVLGQTIAGITAIIMNIKKNPDLHISFKNFRVHLEVIGKILYIGIPSIIMASIGSIMTFCMNKILAGYSKTAVSVFGVYFKLQSFVFMPVFGLNNGMVPIVSYNFGARNRRRLVKTIQLSVLYACGIMLIGLIIMQTMPQQLLAIFDASDKMIEIGVPALRTISLSFVFAGFCIISSSVFQALGNGIFSMGVSIARQLLVLVPVAYLFSKIGELAHVWWAFPIAEIASVSVCVTFLMIMNKKVISTLE